MKKERNFLPLYMQALQIPSGIFILTGKEPIPGGPTGLKPEKKMPDGVLIILWFHKRWKTDFPMQ